MAKYNVTYACGHDQIIDMVGKDREWRLERESQKLCPACWYEESQRQKAAASAKAAAEAQEAGLPTLEGTEKQIAWAETIRAKTFQDIEKLIVEAEKQTQTEQAIEDIKNVKNALKSLKARTDSKWWIDNRGMGFKKLLVTEIEIIKKEAAEPPAEIKKAIIQEIRKSELEAKAEATVEPENKKTPVVAELRKVTINGNDFVELISERSDIIRDVCRGWLFDWISERRSWVRRMTSLNGGIERLVELGNILLNRGVAVRIYDPELRRRAIAGEYERECLRWVKRSEDNKFIISETGAKNYYDAARRIRGSRWDSNIKCVVVPAENYEEVQGFADRYKFQFTKQARELQEEAKEAKEKIQVVAPAKKEKAPELVGVKPGILSVPETVEIDSELIDEGSNDE